MSKVKSKKSKKLLRPAGDVTSDLEILLFELTSQHRLQRGEILALVKIWCDIHMPDCTELYEDGSSPIMYYGPGEGLK